MDLEKERRRKTRLFWALVYGLPLAGAVWPPLCIMTGRFLFYSELPAKFVLIMLLIMGTYMVLPALLVLGLGLLTAGIAQRSHRMKVTGFSCLLATAADGVALYAVHHFRL